MRSIIICFAPLAFFGIAFGQDNGGRRLLDTPDHLVTMSTKGDRVVFTMEAIADFTEDRDNSKPLGTGWDFAGIRVDVNNNNAVDERVDVAFGTRQKTNIFCPQYIIRENASTGCGGLRSKGSVRVEFMATANQDRAHPVYIYEIPIRELTGSGGKIGLVFSFHDPKTRRAAYPNPRKAYTFEETIQVDLSEL